MTGLLLKQSLQSSDMLSLWNTHQKQMLCTVYRISRDSIYPALPYQKNWSPFCTNSSVCSKLWYWRISQYKRFI